MDGILPPQALASAQPQLQQQQFGFEAQNLVTQIQSKLPIGTSLLAQILGNDKNGNIIVRANGSDLVLSSPIGLAKGAQAQIRLDSVSGNIVAQLISVDGKVPVYQPQSTENQPQSNPEKGVVPLKIIQVLPQGTAKIAPENNQAQAAARVDFVTLSSPVTNSFRALIIQPTPEIMQGVRVALAINQDNEEKLIKNLPTEIKAGTEANVKISNVISTPTAPKLTPNAIFAPPQGSAESQPEVDTSNIVLKGQEWMKEAAKFGVENIKNQMESFIPTMKAAPNGNLQINALVIDSKPDGELTVETKLGLMLIDGKNQFPKGSLLELEVTQIAEPVVRDKKPEELPKMDKELGSLKTTLPEHKEHATKLAGHEHNFGAKMVSFINAIKDGDAEKWLGQNFLESLDDVTRSQLVNKLNGDLTNLRNLAADAQPNNWQTVLFPVFDGKDLNQARLHVKKFKDDSNSTSDSSGTRFIVELETSYYGEMQFDGLIRRQVPQKSFDLIIRTHAKLDEETKNGIREIFHVSQDVSKFKGSIDFATNPHFPAEPWKDLIDKKTAHNSFVS